MHKFETKCNCCNQDLLFVDRTAGVGSVFIGIDSLSKSAPGVFLTKEQVSALIVSLLPYALEEKS